MSDTSELVVLDALLHRQPIDWDAWLVYADWLTDQGDIRGRIIGLQHGLETRALDAGERRRLHTQIEVLTAKNKKKLFSDCTLPDHIELEWYLGFVCGVKVPCHIAIPTVTTLRAHPVGRFLSTLRLDHIKGSQMFTLSLSTILRGVTVLDVSGTFFSDQDANWLSGSEHLGALQRLVLRSTHIGPIGVASLMSSERLVALTQLDLSWNYSEVDELVSGLTQPNHKRSLCSVNLDGNRIGSGGLERLVSSEMARSLTQLSLRDNSIGSDGVIALSVSESLRALRSLNLADNLLGADAVYALAESESLSELQILDLNDNRIGAEGIARLARSEHLRSLTSLRLSHNNLCTADIITLTGSPVLETVAELDLTGNALDADGVAALANCEQLTSLHTLRLSGNNLDLEAVRALAQHNPWKLAELTLGYNHLGVQGAQILADAESLRGLVSLDLSTCGIEDAGLRAIASSEALSALIELDISRDNIGLKGARAIASSETLCALTRLKMSGNQLGDKGTRTLAQAPLRSLLLLDLSLNNIGKDGAMALARSNTLDALTRLTLSYNPIGTDGWRALEASPRFGCRIVR